MTSLATFALLGLGVGSLSAQESGSGSAQDPTTAPKAAAPTPAPKANTEELIKTLGADSYKSRLSAERELRAIGKDALPALRAAGEKPGDAEVQWRSRRLVRQIERGDDSGLQQRAPAQPQPFQGGPGVDDIHNRFDQLFCDLEQNFGIDVPTHRFFQDDFFQDLHTQMEAAQKRMEEAMQNGQGLGQGQSMSMQMGPNGVRVEIKSKNEKGEEQSKVYEAPDLQSFQQKYPGVLENNGLGSGFRVWSDGGMGRGFLAWPKGGKRIDIPHPLLPHNQDQAGDDDADQTPATIVVPPPGKRLGVVIRPGIPDELRTYLGLEAGKGLMVDKVQTGTLAEQLGVQPEDIVVQIGDTAIAGTDDVQKALGAVEPGKKVEVHVLRKGKDVQLSATKPAVKEESGGLEQRQPKNRIR